MKFFYSLLFCLCCVLSVGAQEPSVCCQAPRAYEVVNVCHAVRLNTITGEMWTLNWAAQSAKTKVEKFSGGPEVDAAGSYPGRFSIVTVKENGYGMYFLVDHKNGAMWQPVRQGATELQLVLPGE